MKIKNVRENLRKGVWNKITNRQNYTRLFFSLKVYFHSHRRMPTRKIRNDDKLSSLLWNFFLCFFLLDRKILTIINTFVYSALTVTVRVCMIKINNLINLKIFPEFCLLWFLLWSLHAEMTYYECRWIVTELRFQHQFGCPRSKFLDLQD